jgi:TatD DNase family protein
MIDAHCHLEQNDYDSDRDDVIEKCKKQLNAAVTCCAHPDDFNLTMEITEKYKNFIFATFSIHPIYIKDISDKQKDEFLELLVSNKDKTVAIGETGLDYFHVKENLWQQKQKELFIEFIGLSKELKKPLVIHSRDSMEDAIKILEQEDAKNVLMHLFGARKLLQRVIENNWFISVGPIVQRSKDHKKIVRDMPFDKILLETDSPWFGPEGKRNEPTAVSIVANRIAEIKKTTLKEVDNITTQNSIRFFDLKINNI